MKRRLLGLAALAALAACGGGSQKATTGTAASAGDSVAAATKAPAQAMACGLISRAEVERITGLTLVPGPAAPDYQGYSRCEWSRVAGRTDGVILVVNRAGKFDDYSTVPGSVPVSGFGGQAEWNPNVRQMAVQRDTGTVSVSFVVEPAMRAWAEEIMKLALQGLAKRP